MPNWVETEIAFNGEIEEIQRLKEFVKSDSQDFDFNNIIPMPELLRSISSGSTIIDGVRVNTWFEETIEKDGKFSIKSRIISKEEEKELKKLKVTGWYDWSISNWGTKWNCCDSDMQDESVRFSTAWGVAQEIIVKLSELFPKLSFDVIYADEDTGHNLGSFTCEEGEITECYYPEGGSSEALQFYVENFDEDCEYIQCIDGEYSFIEEEDEDA